MEHTCGGELHPHKVKIRKRIGMYYQTFTVDGLKCGSCGEEIIDRDTAREIDRSIARLRGLWKDWRVPADTKETGTVSQDQVFEDNTYVRD